MKSITVLCRGESIRHLDLLAPSDIAVIVNRFGDEILTYPVIAEYIKKSEIFSCTSGSSGELDSLHKIEFFDKFNVTKMIRPYLHEIADTHIRLSNGCNLPNTFLGDVHKKYMYQIPNYKYPYTYPSSGVAAVAFAVLETDCDIINIIGLDFYDNSGYIIDERANPDWGSKGQMQETVIKLVEDHPNKLFNIVTKATKYIDRLKELSNVNLMQV